MTKIEYGKCVKLMEEAIRKAKQSDDEYKEAGRHYANMDSVRQETEQRKADQHYGEAVGIEQALATLGFKHDKMKLDTYNNADIMDFDKEKLHNAEFIMENLYIGLQ